MRRRLLVTVDAPVTEARSAVTRLPGLATAPDGSVTGRLPGTESTPVTLEVHCAPADGASTSITFEATHEVRVPYLGWLASPLLALEIRRRLRHVGALVRADLAGQAAPPTPRLLPLLPPVAFTREQTDRLVTIGVVAAVASFCGALLTQNADAVTEAFHRNDTDLGFALAVARAGVLVSLVAAGLADRLGRRRVLLICLVGAALANALTALAPSYVVFVTAQLFTRAFVNALLVVASIAAVEEAPEGARAFALSMFGLAFGAGFGLSVALLPLADLGDDGWRAAFAVSALAVLLVPLLARRLHETGRYQRLAARTVRRGSIKEIFDRRYGRRFALLGVAVFLSNMFSAPSSQLTNRYLRSEHDFSNTDIAGFRSITAGVPGVIGVLLGGRLAESRGRRPVAVTGLVVAAALQAVFFTSGGPLLWLAPTLAIVAALAGGLALGALDAELFPTEVRGTSNGFLLVCGVAGGAAGLLIATQLESVAGGLGAGIAICAAAPVVAALFVVPRVPETSARALDEVSPSAV